MIGLNAAISGDTWLIILITLGIASSLGFLFSISETRGRTFLIFLVVIAGGSSAWLSLRYPQSAWIIFLATLLLALLIWFLFDKLRRNLGSSSITWAEYLRGQGAVLCLCLIVGGGLAWLSFIYGPYPGRSSKGGQLLKFENLDPSQHSLYEDIDVESYAEVTILTRVESPANGSAMVTLYLDHGGAGKSEIGHLDCEAAAWSRWDQAIAGKRLSLVVGPPAGAGAVPATQVDILVYLSRK